MLRKNIRKRRIIEDSFDTNAHFTLENGDNLVNMSPRSNVTEIFLLINLLRKMNLKILLKIT